MIKAYRAHIEARVSFEAALISAGLKRGLDLTPAQLKAESAPVFWYLDLTSMDASSKETYVTYDVTANEKFAYGDGRVIARKVTIECSVYTRSTNINELIINMEDEITNAQWTFEIIDIDYDAPNKLYYYIFQCEAEVC